MGSSFRVYFIDSDDRIKRIPFSRFIKIKQRDPKAICPEYKDTCIRYARVAVTLENRKPYSIEGISYDYLPFDSSGYVDEKFLRRRGRLAVDLFSIYRLNESEKVINAREQFVRKRVEREFVWTPSPELEAAIIEKILELPTKPTTFGGRPGKVLPFRPK